MSRVISHSITGRDEDFRQVIRARDGGCVLSGQINRSAYRDYWKGYEAAHIWPLEKGGEWLSQGAFRWITDLDETDPAGRMNSPQNGMLMRADIHKLFDDYVIGINPDCNYKIFVFGEDMNSIAGRHLSVTAHENGNEGVRDNLLRWHLRQCVFANMRRSGEPLWDYDSIDPGDVVGRLLAEDKGGERLGNEIASRLALTHFLEM
ncbi:HNH endonuclease-domain-containing protein [Kalaharituber pfeilii]|nr:HNH endonuclease-domain-containing protein [Kalaharituber pfeilii]